MYGFAPIPARRAIMLRADQPEHWRKKALKTRELAAIISLLNDRARLTKLAEQYERLANAAEERQQKLSALRD
jgi:hypothetical protein